MDALDALGMIEVHVPTGEQRRMQPGTLAERRPIEAGARLILIENGKMNSREVLQYIAATLKSRFPIGEIETVQKPSSAKPIDADHARMLAARSRLVLTGVGD